MSGCHAAALDHEAGNHAMEYRTVEEALLDIEQEVFDCSGGFVGEQFEGQRTLRGIDFNARVGGMRGQGEKKGEGK
jgi:hypothetical protein